MNNKPLPIGIDNFEMIITRGYYFVDKTLLIKDLIDNKASVNLFTRPRRFGKTLNMSMLQYFFEDKRNEKTGEKKDNSYLFNGMNIMNEGEEYTSHMEKYPVINLSLKSAKQPTYELAYSCLKEKIIDEFNRHRYILNSEMSNKDKIREEVKKICRDYNMENKYEIIKEWYNGYVFGDVNVYNPWSVVRYIKDLTFYIDDLKANINEYPSSYWANTSSNSIVKSLIERADDETKTEIELLIEGKSIEKPVHEDIDLEEMLEWMKEKKETHYSHSFIGESDKHQKQVLGFLLLFFTGYFKKVSERMDDKDSKLIKLTISNKEVKYIFRTKVLNWFEENIKTRDFTNMYNSILESKPEIFEKELSDVLIESISFNDAYENFYHGFVTGILSSMKGYTVKSNRESGNGRGDIFIRPVSRRKAAIILELKVCKNFNELEQRADDALKQIEEKKYEMELKDDGYNNIIKYGISFFKKDCFIKIKE